LTAKALLTGFLSGLGGSYLKKWDDEHRDAQEQRQEQLRMLSGMADRTDLTPDGSRFLLSSMAKLIGAKDPETIHQTWDALQAKMGEAPQIEQGLAPHPALSMDGNSRTMLPGLPASQKGGLFQDPDVEQQRKQVFDFDRLKQELTLKKSLEPREFRPLTSGLDASGNISTLMYDQDSAETRTIPTGLKPIPRGQVGQAEQIRLAADRIAAAQKTGTPPDAGDLLLVSRENARTENLRARTEYEKIRSQMAPKLQAVHERNAATNERNATTSEANSAARQAGQDVQWRNRDFNAKFTQADIHAANANQWDDEADALEQTAQPDPEGKLSPQDSQNIANLRAAARAERQKASAYVMEAQRNMSVIGQAGAGRAPLRPGSPAAVRQAFYTRVYQLTKQKSLEAGMQDAQAEVKARAFADKLTREKYGQ
jgi:hypothetical protein